MDPEVCGGGGGVGIVVLVDDDDDDSLVEMRGSSVSSNIFNYYQLVVILDG